MDMVVYTQFWGSSDMPQGIIRLVIDTLALHVYFNVYLISILKVEESFCGTAIFLVAS